MSRIGDLQDFLDAVGPYVAPSEAPAPDAELILEPVPVATGLASPTDPPLELDSVTAVTRFPPR